MKGDLLTLKRRLRCNRVYMQRHFSKRITRGLHGKRLPRDGNVFDLGKLRNCWLLGIRIMMGTKDWKSFGWGAYAVMAEEKPLPIDGQDDGQNP